MRHKAKDAPSKEEAPPSGQRGKQRLHIFDFDHTLFYSPGPGPDVPKDERGPFWHDPDSLGGRSVPEEGREGLLIGARENR